MSRIVVPDEAIILPTTWRELAPLSIEGKRLRAFESAFGLRVLMSREDRGKATGVWLHVSVSRGHKLPSWTDMREAKDIFIGRERCAIHMIPPDEFWVNLHPHTLHLFTRLDGPTVPPALYEDQ